jgi:hypothetical protein
MQISQLLCGFVGAPLGLGFLAGHFAELLRHLARTQRSALLLRDEFGWNRWRLRSVVLCHPIRELLG